MKRDLQPHELIERSIIKKFRKTIWNPFTLAVRQYQLIQPGDKIAVCISGGKDSMLMAKLMQLLQRYSEVPFEVVFLVMDPATTRSTAIKLRATPHCCISRSLCSRPMFSRLPTTARRTRATCVRVCAAAICTARRRSLAATKSRWATTSTMSSKPP